MQKHLLPSNISGEDKIKGEELQKTWAFNKVSQISKNGTGTSAADPGRIRIQPGQWIRNPNPDPGGQEK